MKGEMLVEVGGREMDYWKYLTRDRIKSEKVANINELFSLFDVSEECMENKWWVVHAMDAVITGWFTYVSLIRRVMQQEITKRASEMEDVLMKIFITSWAYKLS